jgi:5-methylcytosine-specific restriction endonuclease McrA
MKVNKRTKLYEWQKRNMGIEQVCPRCTKLREMTVEHIIPVHLLQEIGLQEEAMNDEDNFELLCYSCNKFKGGRIDMAHPKTIPLLKKYINSL